MQLLLSIKNWNALQAYSESLHDKRGATDTVYRCKMAYLKQ